MYVICSKGSALDVYTRIGSNTREFDICAVVPAAPNASNCLEIRQGGNLIALNPDRRLVRLASWEEIEQLVGFTRDINPKQVKLASILSPYRISYLVPCGLSSCHKEHLKGYIVVTADGRVTNIGHRCGKTHFGVTFTTMVRKIERDIKDAERRDTLLAFQNIIREHTAIVSGLITESKGGGWLYKQMETLGQLPEQVRRVLDNVVRTRSPVLKRQRLQTEEEANLAYAARNRKPDDAPDRPEDKKPRREMIDEEVDILSGVEALFDGYKLRNLLVIDLQAGLNILNELVVESATTHQLGKWSKWVGEFDTKLAKCREIIAAGRLFFDRNNIAKLAKVAMKEADKKAVLAIARRY